MVSAPGRDKWIHLKVSELERLELKRMADDLGLNTSDFLRSLVGHAKSGIKPKQIRPSRKTDPQLLAGVGKIGSNLNQIGRWVNTHKSAADAAQVLAALLAINAEIKNLIPGQPESWEAEQ